MTKTQKNRKHSGLRQDGKLRKGYKYSGKRTKSGLAQIVKIKKMKGGQGGEYPNSGIDLSCFKPFLINKKKVTVAFPTIKSHLKNENNGDLREDLRGDINLKIGKYRFTVYKNEIFATYNTGKSINLSKRYSWYDDNIKTYVHSWYDNMKTYVHNKNTNDFIDNVESIIKVIIQILNSSRNDRFNCEFVKQQLNEIKKIKVSIAEYYEAQNQTNTQSNEIDNYIINIRFGTKIIFDRLFGER